MINKISYTFSLDKLFSYPIFLKTTEIIPIALIDANILNQIFDRLQDEQLFTHYNYHSLFLNTMYQCNYNCQFQNGILPKNLKDEAWEYYENINKVRYVVYPEIKKYQIFLKKVFIKVEIRRFHVKGTQTMIL